MKTVNTLGSRGNGLKFFHDSFNIEYNKVDPMGMGKNVKASLCAMITAMMAPPS